MGEKKTGTDIEQNFSSKCGAEEQVMVFNAVLLSVMQTGRDCFHIHI